MWAWRVGLDSRGGACRQASGSSAPRPDLVIVAVALAGVTAFTVVHRAKEIAIRIALGASEPGILVLVMKHAFLIVAIGAVVGELT